MGRQILKAIVGLGFLVGSITQAQFLPQPVQLKGSVTSPLPGEAFTILAETPLSDPNFTSFTWTVSGRARPELSGLGRNSISLLAESVGTTITARVDVSLPDGNRGSATQNFIVSDLVITGAADTYIPKWYKGKALPALKSVVRVAAVPNIVIGGARISPEELIYNWEIADQRNAVSGQGKNVVSIFTSEIPNSAVRIILTVEDRRKRILQSRMIFIEPRQTKIVSYRHSPLGGAEYRSSVKLTVTSEESLDFGVEPFFFPIKTKKELDYKWRVGPFSVGGSAENPFLITLDTRTLEGGLFPISVTVESFKDPRAPRIDFGLFQLRVLK